MPTNIGDSKHWLVRAVEARVHAQQMTDEIARKTMLRIAEDYERIAERARVRELAAKDG
jgi:hypothetical protein